MTIITKLKINLEPQSFFNKLADTAPTELFLWTIISAVISYKFLQTYRSISRKLHVLCEIIVFPKAALNPIFFHKSHWWLPWWTEPGPFFYGTSFKANPLLVHFQGSNSPSFILNEGFSRFFIFSSPTIVKRENQDFKRDMLMRGIFPEILVGGTKSGGIQYFVVVQWGELAKVGHIFLNQLQK